MPTGTTTLSAAVVPRTACLQSHVAAELCPWSYAAGHGKAAHGMAVPGAEVGVLTCGGCHCTAAAVPCTAFLHPASRLCGQALWPHGSAGKWCRAEVPLCRLCTSCLANQGWGAHTQQPLLLCCCALHRLLAELCSRPWEGSTSHDSSGVVAVAASMYKAPPLSLSPPPSSWAACLQPTEGHR